MTQMVFLGQSWRELELMKNANKYILLLAAFLAGILVGIVIKNFPDSIVLQYISDISILAGQIFITALKMILVPLVFFSIVNGISNLASSNQAGNIWRSTLSILCRNHVLSPFLLRC